MTDFTLSPKQKHELFSILMEHGVKRILFFGSRVSNNHLETSDLDLILWEPSPFSLSQFSKLKAALEDSNLPMQVDIQRLQSVRKPFLDLISEYGIAVDLQ